MSKVINKNLIKGKLVMKGMNYAMVSSRLGIAMPTFQNKMNGKTEFTLSEALQLCDMIGLDSVEELYEEE